MSDKRSPIIIGLIIGIMIGAVVTDIYLTTTDSPSQSDDAVEAEPQPLYWVAPMDANYRRDKPGLSPMGMDLVPYYEDEGNGSEVGVGTINISSNVVNNLGVKTTKVVMKPMISEINTVGIAVSYTHLTLPTIYSV